VADKPNEQAAKYYPLVHIHYGKPKYSECRWRAAAGAGVGPGMKVWCSAPAADVGSRPCRRPELDGGGPVGALVAGWWG
jgi:hypothetical protein